MVTDKNLIEIDNTVQFWDKYAVIKLLYNFPVYNYESNPDKNNVVIFTDPNLSFQTSYFINCILQFCQSTKKKVNITVVSNDPEKLEKDFFKDKPYLNEIISINNQSINPSGYGNIDFISPENKDLDQIIDNSHYFFVSIEDQKDFKEFQEKLDQIINDSSNFIISEYDNLNGSSVVWLNEDRDFDRGLDRLALNLHMSWADFQFTDINKEYLNFLEEYNYISSLLGAVSIFYKLQDQNIDISDIESAAQLFNEQKEDLAAPLAQLEHGRWIIEKAMEGWESFSKDEYKKVPELKKAYFEEELLKKHACLVPSTDSEILLSYDQTEWDNPSEKDAELDDLDTVSVTIHRAMKEEAKNRLRDKQVTDSLIEQLRDLLAQAPPVIQTVLEQLIQEYELIYYQNPYAGRNFDLRVNELLYLIEDEEVKEEAESIINKIEDHVFPIVRSLNPVNYKQNDYHIVNNIPYILTHKEYRPNLGIGYQIESNANDRFQNIVSSYVLFPEKLVYFTYLSKPDELETFYQYFTSSIDNIFRRIPDCQILINLFLKEDLPESKIDLLRTRLKEIQAYRSSFRFRIIKVANEEQAAEKIVKLIKEEDIKIFDGKPKIFGSDHFDSQFKNRLDEIEKIPLFRFKSKSKEFNYLNHCDSLKYYDLKNFYINLSEIFEIENASIAGFHTPSYTDLAFKLWNLETGANKGETEIDPESYQENIKAWHNLCRKVRSYFNNPKVSSSFNFIFNNVLDSNKERSFEISFSDKYEPVFLSLMDNFLDKNVLVKEPELINKENNEVTYKVITVVDDLKGRLSNFFNNFGDKLKNSNFIKIYSRDDKSGKKDMTEITYSGLKVRNLKMKNFSEDDYELLKKVEKLGLIHNLENSEDGVNFDFDSDEAKALLTKDGEVFELYCYTILKNSGIFDDLALGVSIFNQQTEAQNEFDIIAMKDFRAYVIECKDTEGISQDYIYKLNSLGQEYEINANAILLANNYSIGNNINKLNEVNKRRAQKYKINVINNPIDILNLEEKIRELII